MSMMEHEKEKETYISKAINVFGDKGVGKSRFVEEAAKFLSYRYLFK